MKKNIAWAMIFFASGMFYGCGQQTADKVPAPVPPVKKQMTKEKSEPKQNNMNELGDDYGEDQELFTVKEGKIYTISGVERGSIDGETIEINLGKSKASFTGDKNKLSFFDVDNFEAMNFHYGDIEVSPELRGPYAIYNKVDAIKYACDGSFVKLAGSGKDVPNYYCMTDGKDYLEQFEFNAADGVGFATGGEYYSSWKKIYVRKTGQEHIFFILSLEGEELSSDPSLNEGGSENKLVSKTYLDTLLKDPENVQKVKMADAFVKNIKLSEL